jgi:hypothetical protein
MILLPDHTRLSGAGRSATAVDTLEDYAAPRRLPLC